MIEDKLYDEFIISIIAAEKGDKTFTFTYKKNATGRHIQERSIYRTTKCMHVNVKWSSISI
jgi:hypothetical protein